VTVAINDVNKCRELDHLVVDCHSGALLIFDTTNAASFYACADYLGTVMASARKNFVVMLIGTKVDLSAEDASVRKVSKAQALTFAQHHGIQYFETSEFLPVSVYEAFRSFILDIIAKRADHKHNLHKATLAMNLGTGTGLYEAIRDTRPVVEVNWYTPKLRGAAGGWGVTHSLLTVTVGSTSKSDDEGRHTYIIEKAEHHDHVSSDDKAYRLKNGIYVSHAEQVLAHIRSLTPIHTLEYPRVRTVYMEDLWSEAVRQGPYDLLNSNCHHMAGTIFNMCVTDSKDEVLSLPNEAHMKIANAVPWSLRSALIERAYLASPSVANGAANFGYVVSPPSVSVQGASTKWSASESESLPKPQSPWASSFPASLPSSQSAWFSPNLDGSKSSI